MCEQRPRTGLRVLSFEERQTLRRIISHARLQRALRLLADERRDTDYCDNCRSEYTPAQPTQRFCSEHCRKLAYQRHARARARAERRAA